MITAQMALTLMNALQSFRTCQQVFAAGKCHIIDVLDLDEDALFFIQMMLEDERIIKVVHDCRQDSAALFYQMDIRVKPIFDTQV